MGTIFASSCDECASRGTRRAPSTVKLCTLLLAGGGNGRGVLARRALRRGLESSVMLELDPDSDALNALRALSILVFITTKALRDHVAAIGTESPPTVPG